MQITKKAGQARPAKYLKNESSHKDNINYLIADRSPDLLIRFTRQRKIAETRQNPQIKNAMLQDIAAIYFALGELHQQVEYLYQENAHLKQSDQQHRRVIESLATQSGIDPNVEQSYIRQQSIITNQLESLKKKGLL